MKNILTLSLLAAFSAFLLVVSLSFEVSVAALFAAGLVVMFVADYAHVWHPTGAPVAAEVSRRERLQLAA